jgi:tRNA(Ile)-lysidine synthase
MRRPPAVARVLERVTRTAREHDQFRPGETVLVCVSGGPDSVCLLYSLWFLRRMLRVRLEVFHLDHRLRPDSPRDAGYVRRLGERLRIAVHAAMLEDAPPAGASVEAWARGRRLDAAAETARVLGAQRIALGHTRDDQAVTLLEWAIMGGGLRALKPVSGDVVRPLLDVSRAEVEDFCRSLRLRPRRDPSNRDRRFLRNALELDAIPVLERATGRGVLEPLARTASLAAEDDDELSRRMRETWDAVVRQPADGVQLMTGPLLALPRALSRRLVARAIFGCGVPATDADVAAVLDLAAGRPGRRRDLAAGLKARRAREYVSLSRTSPESRE